MVRGRKPKPTRLKILEGNPGKRKLPDDEPKPEIAAPAAPAFLDSAGRSEWKRVVAEMLAMKTLAKADRGILTAYCVAWSTLSKAIKEIREKGEVVTTSRGNDVQSPWLRIQAKAMDHLVKFSAELGLSPASRTRVKITTPTAEKPDSLKLFNEKRNK